MEEKFDLEDIDFSKISNEGMQWILVLLLFAFGGNEDKEKYQKLKEKFEKEIYGKNKD